MKSIVNRIVVLLVLGAITSVLALGKTTERKVNFKESLSVNGTVVEKGAYKVSFNDETGELTIKKGEKVVATAQARLEKTNYPQSFYSHSGSDDPAKAPALVSISFKGGNLATIVNNGTSARQ
jgi:hypothetical protein